MRQLRPSLRIQSALIATGSKLRRARFFGTHAPREAGEEHAGDPGAVLARPISLASDPVAAGRPRPGPRARVRVTRGVNAGPPKPINHNYAAAQAARAGRAASRRRNQ